MEAVKPVILDVGNAFTKIGLSDPKKTSPDHIFPSDEASVDHSPESVIADRPISDWETFALITKHALESKISIQSSQQPILMIEKPGLERQCRQKLVEFAFEELEVPAFFLASEPVMALYSVGLSSGIVLSSSYKSSNVSTVHDGHRPPYGLVQLGFGGRDVTKYTQNLLKDKFGKEVDHAEAEQFKCRHGHFEMKDRTCNPGYEQFENVGRKIAEFVLHPEGDCIGFHKVIPRCIYLTDEEDDYEPVYFRNIMLCGGNTLFPGINEKLESEVETPDYLSCGVRVIAPPFRQYAAWIGGSIAASLPTFKSFWITKQDYHDHGENILSRKCLPY